MWNDSNEYNFVLPTEIIKKQGDEGVPDLVHVMRTLASEAIPNLPPGGELASKWVGFVVRSNGKLTTSLSFWLSVKSLGIFCKN